MDLGSLIGAALQQGLGGRNPGAARLQQGAHSVGGPGGGMEDLMAALSGAGGSGGGGAFGALMGQMMGAAPETKSAAAPAGGLGGLLGQLTGGGGVGAVLSQLTGGSAARPGGGGDLGAMLGGLLSGGSRTALGGGAVGMLAAVAMQALRSGAAAAPAPVAPPQARELVDADAEALVLRAMISAAKADGRLDAGEEAALIDKLGADGVDGEERAFVEAELRTPVDVAALAAQARNPAQAAQVYAASLLAIEVDTAQERAYLRALADALGLSPAQAAAIHQATGAPAP